MLLTNYLSNLEERAVLRRDERQLLRSMLILRLAQVKLQPFRGMSHPPTKKTSTLHSIILANDPAPMSAHYLLA